MDHKEEPLTICYIFFTADLNSIRSSPFILYHNQTEILIFNEEQIKKKEKKEMANLAVSTLLKNHYKQSSVISITM